MTRTLPGCAPSASIQPGTAPNGRPDERDDACRAESGQQASGRLCRGDRQERNRSHEIGEAGDLEPREEEPVANSVGRDLLRDQHRGSERRDEMLALCHEGLVLPTSVTMRARMAALVV